MKIFLLLQVVWSLEDFCSHSSPKASPMVVRRRHVRTADSSVSSSVSNPRMVREDSQCGLLENSCDDGDVVDNDGSILGRPEWVGRGAIEGGVSSAGILLPSAPRASGCSNKRTCSPPCSTFEAHLGQVDKEESPVVFDETSQRNSLELSNGFGCLPCTSSPSKAAKKCASSLIICNRVKPGGGASSGQARAAEEDTAAPLRGSPRRKRS